MFHFIKRMFQIYLINKLFNSRKHHYGYGSHGHTPWKHALLGGLMSHKYRKHRYHSKPSLFRMLKKLF